YTAKKKVEELLKSTKPEVFDFFDTPSFSFSSLKDVLNSGSLFDDKKTILLRDVFSNAGFMQEFLEKADILKDTDDLVIFFETRQVPLTEGLISFFKKNGKVFEFKSLKTSEVDAWVKSRVEELGCSIDNQALFALTKAVGNDLWRLSLEIQKLVAFGFKHKKIEKYGVELLVKQDIDSHIFNTIEAIANKDKKTALELLYNHLEIGDHPSYLLAMIAYQFRNLIIVKDLSDVSVLKGKMHPFVVSKSRQLSQKFTKERLEKIYSKIFKMDFAIKQGKIKPVLALELLIADI
ncbi:DNA polymerase III subunit delta, partial [Patescibacteria group bacterium]|nr:DNA polymerase III subunit delta [Patescibacteria group bacterium]